MHENEAVSVRVNHTQLDAVTAQLFGTALALDETSTACGLHNVTSINKAICVRKTGVSNGRGATRTCAETDLL